MGAIITLLPGDVLLSGTPANSRLVQPGDVVEVEVEGLGRLTNHIVEGPIPVRADIGAQPSESEEVLFTAPRRRLGIPGHPPTPQVLNSRASPAPAAPERRPVRGEPSRRGPPLGG